MSDTSSDCSLLLSVCLFVLTSNTYLNDPTGCDISLSVTVKYVLSLDFPHIFITTVINSTNTITATILTHKYCLKYSIIKFLLLPSLLGCFTFLAFLAFLGFLLLLSSESWSGTKS